MEILFIAVYVIFCLLVAWAGRRALNFVLLFFLCLLVTPLFAAILLLLFGKRRMAKGKQR